jgi:hypothetical protein
MKKMFFIIFWIISSFCFAFDNDMPPQDSTGFNQYKSLIQKNFNEMCKALPLDQQNKIWSASASMENIRLKPPLEAEAIFSNERQCAEQSMKTAVFQMSVTDVVKSQIENARNQMSRRMSEKVLDLKARRAASH